MYIRGFCTFLHHSSSHPPLKRASGSATSCRFPASVAWALWCLPWCPCSINNQRPTRTMCSEQPQAIGSHLLVYSISVMHLIATPIWSNAWLTLRMDSWHADVDRSAAHAFPQTFQETKARSHPLPTPAGLSNVVWLLSQPPPGWMQPQGRGKYWGNLLSPPDLDKLSCKLS